VWLGPRRRRRGRAAETLRVGQSWRRVGRRPAGCGVDPSELLRPHRDLPAGARVRHPSWAWRNGRDRASGLRGRRSAGSSTSGPACPVGQRPRGLW